MNLVYLDEVKFQEGQQPYYWLCGLAIDDRIILEVENALSDLAEEYFGTRILRAETEFHASHIVHGKGPYKGDPLDGRVELFKRLVNIIDDNDLGRIVIRLEPTRIMRTDIETIAFMYFVERVDGLMRRHGSKALLIADHDKDLVTMNVANLSNFRVDGTDFEYGREINHVVDTVHHTHSHHSRLIQLADLFTYGVCLSNKQEFRYPKDHLVQYMKAKQNFLFPSTYKYWPP